MANRNIFIGLGILIGISAIAFLAIPKKISKPAASSSPSQISQEVVPSPSPEAATALAGKSEKEIVISGSEFSFSPNAITLKAGEETQIRFKNTGKVPHNLTISELGVSTRTIPGGQEDVITVTAPKAGEHTVYCSVGTHKQMGMVGKMEVK